MKCSEKALAKTDPFSLIEDGHLTIKTKAGEMKPFIMNRAQLHLNNIIKKLWFDNKIIRIFILKARQLGVSTYIEALIFAITSQLENQNATIIADDLDGSNYIFDMSKLYQEKLPDHLKVPTKKSNEKKLEFEGTHSQIIIDTAENKDAGRKYTFRIAHLSEYAFFKHAEELMVGLSQAVPSLPRTMVIKETTANGFNFAKDEWDTLEEGKTDELAIFIPWFWGEEYQMEAIDFILGDTKLGIISEEEPIIQARMLKEGFDKIPERLTWRRWCIRHSCGMGSDESRVANFKQEYPSTPEEAFKASGDCFFDKEAIIRQIDAFKPPIFKADIVEVDNKFELRKSPEGLYEFYEDRHLMEEYVLGGDASSGSGTDYGVLKIRSKLTNKVCASFRGKVDTDELEERAYLLGNYFNKALIAIENDKFGFAVNQKLMKRYGNMFYQETVDEKTKKRRKKYGWETNSKTRPLMLSLMQEEIRQGALNLEDKISMKECLTFIRNAETGKVEAQSGCNDDTVITHAICGIVRQLRPIKKKDNARESRVRMFTKNQPVNAGFGF